MRLSGVLAIIAIACGSILPATASELKPLSIYGTIDASTTYFPVDGDYNYYSKESQITSLVEQKISFVTGGTHASAEFGGFFSPSPHMYAAVSVAAPDDGGSNAIAGIYAQLRYQVEFTGADGQVPVFVHARSSLDYSGGPFNFMNSDVLIASDSILAEANGNQEINGFYNFDANKVYDVIMTLDISASQPWGGDFPNYSYASLSVDPYFAVDSSVADQYKILLSDGVGNSPIVSPVPLPASAPMFGAALLALAGFGYSMNRWVAPKGNKAASAA